MQAYQRRQFVRETNDLLDLTGSAFFVGPAGLMTLRDRRRPEAVTDTAGEE